MYNACYDSPFKGVARKSLQDMEAGILLYLLIAFQQFTSALEIQVIALMQLYAVFYAVLSLSITGYIPAPEYPEMYDSAVSCLFSNPSIV